MQSLSSLTGTVAPRRSPVPCAKSRRKGIPVLQKLCRGCPLTHPSWSSLRVGSQPRHLHLTCSSLIKVETLNRLWRSELQCSPQARLNTLQKDIQKKSLGICLSIITDQSERHHPWEVSGRVMKYLVLLSSKFFAQTHPSISSDGPTAQPSPTAQEHSAAPRQELWFETLDTLLRQHINNPHLLYFIKCISQAV